jgi:hypothetical protein
MSCWLKKEVPTTVIAMTKKKMKKEVAQLAVLPANIFITLRKRAVEE